MRKIFLDDVGDGYWVMRERAWARRGVTRADGSPFTRHDFLFLAFTQGWSCRICGHMLNRRANVDHSHGARGHGPARGLICWRCNRWASDMSLEEASGIVKYLSRFSDIAPLNGDKGAPQHGGKGGENENANGRATQGA